MQELAKHGADHAEQLQELGAQLGHFAQSGAHAQAQVRRSRGDIVVL